MKIIVDCMSGDYAPDEIVKGALLGANEHKINVLLVGDKPTIEKLIKENNLPTEYMEIHQNEGENVTMEDEPSVVMKEKKSSSMAVALELLKKGEGDALVSAGNTGALLTGATLIIRRIKGIRRAALGAIIPFGIPMLLADAGAQTDCTPENIGQFALMGKLFMEKVMKVTNPRVALINNGAEEHKGTELYSEAHKLLKTLTINFMGNIEGRDIPMGICDVMVADGFTGNIVLKMCEGAGIFVKKTLKSLFFANFKTKLAALLVKSRLATLKKEMDYSEFGGAPFLGISKPVIKAHGSSKAKSIVCCLLQAKEYASSGIIEEFEKLAQNPQLYVKEEYRNTEEQKEGIE